MDAGTAPSLGTELTNPDTVALLEWLGRDEPFLLTLSSLEPLEVRPLVHDTTTHLLLDLHSLHLNDVFEALKSYVQDVITRLIQIPDFTVGEELQRVLDQNLYSPILSTLFETLWTARFEHREGHDVEPFLSALLRLTFETPSIPTRCDAFVFWFTLLHQNYPVDYRQALLILTSHQGFDPDLWTFLKIAEYWKTLGSPLRVVTNVTSLHLSS